MPGYFGHCNDYWTEIDKCGMSVCQSAGSAGSPAHGVSMVDLWEQDHGGAVSRPANDHNNSQACQIPAPTAVGVLVDTNARWFVSHCAAVEPLLRFDLVRRALVTADPPPWDLSSGRTRRATAL